MELTYLNIDLRTEGTFGHGISDGDFRSSGGNEPMFGAKFMALQRKTLTRFHSNSFNFVIMRFEENLVGAPRAFRLF